LQAAQLGLLLFSQLTEWPFDWPVESRNINFENVAHKSGTRNLMVSPALAEKIDEPSGVVLKTVLDPVFVAI
jgi:hypothetical protein